MILIYFFDKGSKPNNGASINCTYLYKQNKTWAPTLLMPQNCLKIYRSIIYTTPKCKS